MERPLTFTSHVVEEIALQIKVEERSKPDQEVGGLLLGTTNPPVVWWAPGCTNQCADRSQGYAIDPGDMDRILGGFHDYELLGTWHTHPNGRDVMSAADAAMAEQTGLLLIVAPALGDAWKWRVYDPAVRVAGSVEQPCRVTEIAFPHSL